MGGTTTVTPDVSECVEEEVWQAPPWRVILHNDDVTTMEFVVWLLMTLFGKPFDEATRLMLEVHHQGSGVATVCARERAELYVEQVHSLARGRGFPLVASTEPV
jgi:ATP-dependent Clp protease adaptor protein ClpS